MKTAILAGTILLILLACKKQKAPGEIIIEGNVKNMPEGKIYLTDAHRWKVPLDSTICTNGHFIFKVPSDSFVPYKASIHFPHSSMSTNVGSLFFRNHMRGPDSMKYAETAFYLERGYTRIEGDNKNRPYLRVFAGKETDLMYNTRFSGFGWLGKIDSVKRLQRIDYFKKEIKQNSYSYFLLQNIYGAKEQYSKEEIIEILGLFDSDVRNSKLGDQFRTYLANRPDPNEPYPNLSLLNASNQKGNIINTGGGLTMLIFWASWCGPCRMEIPDLKEIQAEYKDKGLHVVSISIDDNKENWIKALDQEKMPWTQYIVDMDNIELVKQQFNFYAIPFVVFTDKTGKEIKKFTGYEKEQKENYENVIKKFLE